MPTNNTKADSHDNEREMRQSLDTALEELGKAHADLVTIADQEIFVDADGSITDDVVAAEELLGGDRRYLVLNLLAAHQKIGHARRAIDRAIRCDENRLEAEFFRERDDEAPEGNESAATQ